MEITIIEFIFAFALGFSLASLIWTSYGSKKFGGKW
jgi:hypothetical protein